jgi:hypothetical protein
MKPLTSAEMMLSRSDFDIFAGGQDVTGYLSGYRGPRPLPCAGNSTELSKSKILANATDT